MARKHPDNPLLSDEEVTRVLGRAAQLEQRTERGRLTAGEVLDIAREAGIDEAAARRALGEVLAARTRAGRGLLGVQVHFSARAEADRHLDEENLREIASVLRQVRKVSGTARVGGGELVWKDAEGINVSVASRGDVTEVSASTSLEALSQSSLSLFCVGGGLAGVYIGKLLGLPAPEAMIVLFTAGLGAGAGGWLLYWRQKTRRWNQRLAAIVTLLKDEIGGSSGETDA